ncbi:hypothetical protein AMJ39_01165 [candidate division TA06 bacterium DG_24]|uniref:Recombinase zinc beta ribbon domain-containing protein n=1 Tax=candidate division TA06 bacterium DG_24 TaxID=1703770 RepID=A0A0S7WWJ1_UNCT6|nr:MAG: hypothetical protein AMJ39_01165 [candidate division TA06 bacterium DG_24]
MYGHACGKRSARYYYCPNSRMRRGKTCRNQGIKAMLLEDLVLEQVREDLMAAKNLDSLAEELAKPPPQDDMSPEVARAERELREVREKRRRWEGIFERGELPEEYLSDKIRPLLEREAQLERQIRSFSAKGKPGRASWSRKRIKSCLAELRRRDRPQEARIIREALRILLDGVLLSPKREDGCREVRIEYALGDYG